MLIRSKEFCRYYQAYRFGCKEFVWHFLKDDSSAYLWRGNEEKAEFLKLILSNQELVSGVENKSELNGVDWLIK